MKSPVFKTTRALDMALYPANDPALREATPQTVSSLTLEDVKQYYAKTLRPDLTTIVVIGDITPAEARSAIEKGFGEWKASGAKPGSGSAARSSRTRRPRRTFRIPANCRILVNLSETVEITRFDPDYYPLQMGNHVLGGGFYATRLYHDLRQVNGYVYNVDVRMNAEKTRTVYTVTYACDPKNVSKARELIQRDLVAMQKENVTEAELQQAKALLLRQIPLAESSESGVARGLLATRSKSACRWTNPCGEQQIYFVDDRGSSEGSIRKADSSGGLRANRAGAGAAIIN